MDNLRHKIAGIAGLIAFAAAAAVNAKPIEGQVFIATAGGQAIKLPLVQIAVVPRAELETLVAKVQTRVEDDRKKCYPELADVEQKYKRASEEFRRISDQVPSPGKRGYAAAYQRQAEAIETNRRLYAQRNRLLARRAAIDSPLRYFEELPRPVATAKTDADGRFNVELPEEGAEYAVIAKASRNVFGTVESYFWMVRLPNDASKIMLSNDNLSKSGSTESLIATKQ